MANEPSSTDSLNNVLQREAAGGSVDRRAALSDVDPANAAANWQAGRIEVGERWVEVEELEDQASSRLWDEYVLRRDRAPLNVQTHRALALWCMRKQLAPQARAHWNGVLQSLPDDLEARRALGHQRIDDRWYPREAVMAAQVAGKQYLADLTQWMPKMRRLAGRVQTSSTRQQQAALDELQGIQDSTAIAALEITAAQLSDQYALPFIQQIAEQQSQAACLALCRIALEAPQSKRGELAIAAVRGYAKEFYAAELLSLLMTPAQTTVNYGVNARGELLIHRAMVRETQAEKLQVNFGRLVRISTVNTVGARLSRTPGELQSQNPRLASGRIRIPSSQINTDEIAAGLNAVEDQQQLDWQIRNANRASEEHNTQVLYVLAQTTGVDFGADVNAWWAWWNDHNDRYQPEKPVRSYAYDYTDRPRIAVNDIATVRLPTCECLVRGTLVQTDRGLRAIDTLKAGDMVLSQDVVSGELAFKPVLQTTIRPPKSTLRIVTESGEIQATDGHRWWVAGKGWLMTRQLQPEMLLHTASATVRIKEVIADPKEQEAYNLVVADFNTYFVGEERVLSFDNSTPEPTLLAVPGLALVASNHPSAAQR
ncbi:polymorphic toxin-type HINT domain-containing protein [Aureliella helgolandensis]|nr:polymorphic toxin-type HINT domain-containing protein [Aureliella helgolandensis]